jgi:hypothetical protein
LVALFIQERCLACQEREMLGGVDGCGLMSPNFLVLFDM